MAGTERVVHALAVAFGSHARCVKAGNTEWEEKHKAAISSILQDAPSGSGIDNGTKLDWERSTEEKLVFQTSFHHMTEGFYDGWTEHTVTVRPSFVFGVGVKVSGRNRNDIKDYLAEVFGVWMQEEAPTVKAVA